MIFVVTTHPLPGTSSHGCACWFHEDDRASAQAVYDALERTGVENPDGPTDRVRLWNAFPVVTWDTDAISDYVEGEFVDREPDGTPLADTHPEQGYEMCAHCSRFIEPNDGPTADRTPFLHMHRGDEPGTMPDESHEAEQSGDVHTLGWWEQHAWLISG